MEILREEVLAQVIGGDRGAQNFVNSYISGVKDGFIKDFGPLSVVRGAAQFFDSIIAYDEATSKSNSSDQEIAAAVYDGSNAVGKVTGGVAQIYVTVKLAQLACKMLSKNERVKKFFS